MSLGVSLYLSVGNNPFWISNSIQIKCNSWYKSGSIQTLTAVNTCRWTGMLGIIHSCNERLACLSFAWKLFWCRWWQLTRISCTKTRVFNWLTMTYQSFLDLHDACRRCCSQWSLPLLLGCWLMLAGCWCRLLLPLLAEPIGWLHFLKCVDGRYEIIKEISCKELAEFFSAVRPSCFDSMQLGMDWKRRVWYCASWTLRKYSMMWRWSLICFL